MKYKHLVLEHQKNELRYRLLYTFLKIVQKKQTGETMQQMSDALATPPASVHEHKGNRNTIIRVNSFYNPNSPTELENAVNFASKLAQMNIVDEININLPQDLYRPEKHHNA